MKQGIAHKAITAALTGVLAFSGALAPVATACAEEDSLSEQSASTPTSYSPKWERLAGEDRYKTMSAIVDEVTANGPGSYAVLASGAQFPDALAASALANTNPIILTAPDKLSSEAASQLSRLAALNLEQVYIVGGEVAVSTSVEAEVQALGLKTHRIAGANRQATSVEVAKHVGIGDAVFVATGSAFADALSISAYAAGAKYKLGSIDRYDHYYTYHNTPIILANSDGTLPNETVAYLQEALDAGDAVILLGGTAAVSDQVKEQLGDLYHYERLGGANRYETSANIAQWEMDNGFTTSTHGSYYDPAIEESVSESFAWESVIVATGEKAPDALAGAPLAALRTAPILLVHDASDATVKLVEDKAALINKYAYILGGNNAVSESLEGTLQTYIDNVAEAVAEAHKTYGITVNDEAYAGKGKSVVASSIRYISVDESKAGETVLVYVHGVGEDDRVTVKINGVDAALSEYLTEAENSRKRDGDPKSLVYWFTMPAKATEIVVSNATVE